MSGWRGGRPSSGNAPGPQARMRGSPGTSAPRRMPLRGAGPLCLLHISVAARPRHSLAISHLGPGKTSYPGEPVSSPPSPPSSSLPARPGALGPHDRVSRLPTPTAAASRIVQAPTGASSPVGELPGLEATLMEGSRASPIYPDLVGLFRVKRTPWLPRLPCISVPFVRDARYRFSRTNSTT